MVQLVTVTSQWSNQQWLKETVSRVQTPHYPLRRDMDLLWFLPRCLPVRGRGEVGGAEGGTGRREGGRIKGLRAFGGAVSSDPAGPSASCDCGTES